MYSVQSYFSTYWNDVLSSREIERFRPVDGLYHSIMLHQLQRFPLRYLQFKSWENEQELSQQNKGKNFNSLRNEQDLRCNRLQL